MLKLKFTDDQAQKNCQSVFAKYELYIFHLMSSTRSSISLNVVFLSFINFLLNKLKQQQYKTYDYTQKIYGQDYVFETDNLTKGYMTGQGKGIKRGDYIILQQGSQSERYQVEEIDYYSEPSDMWMASLKKAVEFTADFNLIRYRNDPPFIPPRHRGDRGGCTRFRCKVL